MQRIGQGLQYTVYDIGGGRVRKVPNARKVRLHKLATWGFDPEKAALAAEKAERAMHESHSCLKMALPHIDITLLANPIFLKGLVYEQDKVRTVGEVLQTLGEVDAHRIIFDYISATETLWGWSIGESVFNFTINCGVAEDDRLVFLDLGEMVFSLEDMLLIVEGRRWERAWSITGHLRPSLRAFAVAHMNERFTEERLRSIWGSKR